MRTQHVICNIRCDITESQERTDYSKIVSGNWLSTWENK